MVTVGTRRDEVRRLLQLGVPAALTQLGWMMLGVVDTQFQAIDLICDLVEQSNGAAEIVSLDRLAQRATT